VVFGATLVSRTLTVVVPSVRSVTCASPPTLAGGGTGGTVLLLQSEKSCLTIRARTRVLASATLDIAIAAARTARPAIDRRIG